MNELHNINICDIYGINIHDMYKLCVKFSFIGSYKITWIPCYG